MVDFSAISPHLNVRMSAKARRLALRLDAHAGRVDLVIPNRASLRKAYEFAELNRDWIMDKIGALPVPVPFVDGQALPVLGEQCVIRIEHSARKTTDLSFEGQNLLVRTGLDDPSPRITRFLRQQAEIHFHSLALEKAARLNRKITAFSVKEMKSRWGSCSIDGRMTLSWRLIFAPRIAADYVIAHEAAHLIHPDHGKSFWALCEDLSDDYRAGKEWMRHNGTHLGRFGKVAV